MDPKTGSGGGTPPAGDKSGGTPGEGDKGGASLDKVLEALNGINAKMEERDGQFAKLKDDFVGLRKKLTTKPTETPKDDPAAKGEEGARRSDDPLAQLELGELLGSLPAAARDLVKERLREGATLAEARREAELIQKAMGLVETNKPSTDETSTPPGRTVTGPKAGTGPKLESWSDWQALSQEERASEFKRNPEIEPWSLKGGPCHVEGHTARVIAHRQANSKT